ncbi:MAG: acetyl-CoA carboxylase biotin carboxyl carrier protein subunit [bacterium]|nr:acetyl-CoA carboxylase biotin carboxyl carrier protein subunit [bacterium]
MKEFYYEVNQEITKVTIQKIGNHVWKAIVNERELTIHLDDRQSTRLDVRINGRGYHCHIDTQGNDRFISWKGSTYALRRVDSLASHVQNLDNVKEKDFEPEIRSPMPGKVVKIHVQEGDIVVAKQPLLILEAMKMEYVITAPKDCIIQKILFHENDQVDLGNTLITLTLKNE